MARTRTLKPHNNLISSCGRGIREENSVSERLGQLDIVFAVDNTGSMGPYINNAKQKILEIIRTIQREELCHRLRIGLVSYRDHPPQEKTYVTKKNELTSDTQRIEKNIMAMNADGGGDGPEAVADALEVANRMEFLLDSAKIVVLIGDAPPHGVEPNDNWSDGCPEGIKWEEEVEKAYDQGIVVHTVGCFPEISTYENAIGTFVRIAEGTKGRFIPLKEAELLVKVITGIAVEEIDKLAIQKSILEDLGISMEELNEEDLTEDKIADLVAAVRSKGMTRRAMKAEAPSGLASSEDVEVMSEEVDEEDVREAVRQLRKKAKK
ncbi:MAG: VWA domain-containing protein [Candidatus Lokiarchaeota archaeon]|nr:VWA domain-containing protein [Candidatus Lokiarchaeota archaeon]